MILTVVFENRWQSYLLLSQENQSVPYDKRTVQIHLTKEQIEQLRPREVGLDGNKRVYEDIRECWIECNGF
jgi:hypothetical protein